MSQLVPEIIRALCVSARRQTNARSEYWRMVVPQLAEPGVVKLIIELPIASTLTSCSAGHRGAD